MKRNEEIAIIIGGGPAGLTAGYELLTRTNIRPIILEMSDQVGGISKTVLYKGNRIDIGGHRFYSKSARINKWWGHFLPTEGNLKNDENSDLIMLNRRRISRIFFLGKFFNYPISLDFSTLKKLGLARILRIIFTYSKVKLFPLKKIDNMEAFFVNRFGTELFNTFFKDYTEKVWGVPCNQIKPDWGSQRVKGLSIFSTIYHALTSRFADHTKVDNHKTETSLIDRFLYPKFGPGQLWEEVAKHINFKGGEILFNRKVVSVEWINSLEVKVIVQILNTGIQETYTGKYLFSTMPIKDLISSMGEKTPFVVQEIARGLIYRDFITVGLLLKKMKIKHGKTNDLIPDNWIYIQEKEVSIGRLQIFNNWSPYMVENPEYVWLGLEYFCNEGDELWSMKDTDFTKFAIAELSKINMIFPEDVMDSTIIRVPKAYPAYFGSYNNLDTLTKYTDTIENMFLIGRNGMHKYNNQDHSMLTAMVAVDNILENRSDKSNIWSVNTEVDYQEDGTAEA